MDVSLKHQIPQPLAVERDGAEGDDLLQEITLALWAALPRFRGESSERTWVYRVAHNTGISYIAGADGGSTHRARQREQPRGRGN
ncbi:MAG: hypothetical protein EXQ47_12375 [Bryobacterales bacterium]|nr:hypothetical protein [Bryobacterales bacterium]